MGVAIEIGRLHNRCQLWGAAHQAVEAQRQLSRLAAERLPDVLSGKLEMHLGSFLPAGAVCRIRRLRLRMQLGAQHLDTFLAADAWAEQFLSALKEAMGNENHNFAIFRDEADYSAAFVAALMHGTAWQDWRFEEFRPLRYLDEQEAAVQHVLARLAVLTRLPAAMAQHEVLIPFLNKMTTNQAEVLFKQCSGCAVAQVFTSEAPVPQTAQITRRLLKYLESEAGHKSPAQRWITSVLLALAEESEHQDHPEGNRPGSLREICLLSAHLDIVRRYRIAISQLFGQQQTDSLDEKFVVASNGALPESVARIAQWLGCSRANTEYLQTLLSEVGSLPAQSLQDAPGSEKANVIADPFGQQVHSAKAGLALLIPILLTLNLEEHYSSARLRQALFHCVDGEEGEVAWLDWLLPDDEGKAYPESLPGGWQLGLCEAQQQNIAGLDGVEQLSQLILAQFAARLSGMQQSSKSYLQKQFLCTSGSIERCSDAIHVRLSPMPLLIVLQMSGLCPCERKLPWSETVLTIEVADV